MPSTETAPKEEPTGLSTSRADFAASLGRRLESVLGALTAFEQQPESSGRRDNFLRRVHALGASARVLGFAAAAEIFARVEQQIRTSPPETLADDILAVRKYLAELPNLVLRGPYSLAPQSRTALEASHPQSLLSDPLAVVVWATPDFVENLRNLDRSGALLEITVVDDPDKLQQICVALGPDLLLLDANKGSITLLVDELAQSPEVANVAIVVVNVPEDAAAGLRELGARTVLPNRLTDQQLARALTQARQFPIERPTSPAPIGNVTLKDLAERLAQEIREGLVDAAEPAAQVERLQLDDGTPIRAALWAALAQIREQLTEATEGRVRFLHGPEGSVPLAPRSARSSATRDRADVESVDLSGRRILVVDDDPAVAWFVSGTLRAAGAIVTEALDGAQALQVAFRLWPELIVSDVIMPGLDGFALCHAIKRDVLLRDIPIVLLSWKEDLLFRMRDLGADADGYLRKEASASTIVRRVRELLLSRSALERRLQSDDEIRGRLDGSTSRLLLELTSGLRRPVRIALRDAAGLFDIRMRHGSLVSLIRRRHDGTVERGDRVINALLAITAGRFSVVTDREPCEPMFSGSLQEILAPAVTRARAAQRLLSGSRLGEIDALALEPDAFGPDLPALPLSLRPIADELLRGSPPRQLLASGVASVQLLESLLGDVARRGAVVKATDSQGDDLLEREIRELTSKPSVVPPKPAQTPPPLFTFQLSPTAPEVRESYAATSPTPTALPGQASTDAPNPPQTAAIAAVAASLRTSTIPAHPASKAPPADDVDWAAELNWDSSPPPAGPTSTANAFDNRPPTSGGFMRPAIATLERRANDQTPDLANAVARAVSAETPRPSTTADSSLATIQAAPEARPSALEEGPEKRAELWVPAAAGAERPPAPPSVATSGHVSTPRFRAEPRPFGVETKPFGAVETDPSPNFGPGSTHPAGAHPSVAIAESTTSPGDASGDTTSTNIQPAQESNDAEQAKATNPNTPDRESATSPVHASAYESTPREGFLATPATKEKQHGNAPTKLHDAVSPAKRTSEVSAAEATPFPFGKLAERSTLAESPSALPTVHQPPRPKVESSASRPKDVAGPPEREVDEPVFPLVSTANASVDVQPSIDVGEKDASILPTKVDDGDGPRPVQPVVAQPSKTTDLAATATSDGAKPKDDTEVAPTGSELAASTGDKDRSAPATYLVNGSGASDPVTAAAASDGRIAAEPPVPEHRDTLRSPGGAQLGNQNPPIEYAVASSSTSQRRNAAVEARTVLEESSEKPAPADSGSDGSQRSSSRPHADPQSRPASSAAPGQPRPVGWIQALGLAALAGIVTFAITVPIASWIREHREAPPSTPPVASETFESAAVDAGVAVVAAGETSAPASTDAAGGTAKSDSAPTPSAEAKVEDIPVPADVSLPPGQALIEVSTGGGHAIFLDDAFVGRGPLRVIPVQPGKHVVRTRLNGVERSDSIDVSAGRSVRLSLEQTWK